MNPTDDELSILQNFEFAMVQFWHEHPEMMDYTALRAYEAAFEKYRAELRGRVAKPSALGKLDAAAFAEVVDVCEFRLNRVVHPKLGAGTSPPVSLEMLVGCLREMTKSVERHTKSDGRLGYLTFIKAFVK
jgi:hypothetical protein